MSPTCISGTQNEGGDRDPQRETGACFWEIVVCLPGGRSLSPAARQGPWTPFLRKGKLGSKKINGTVIQTQGHPTVSGGFQSRRDVGRGEEGNVRWK